MSWTILSIGYPYAAVSEDAVGGAEQVLAMLDGALTAAGHRSIVIAPEGSRVRGELRAIPATGVIDDGERARIYSRLRATIEESLTWEPVDLVHLHGIDFAEYLPPEGFPALATLHLPLSWYAERALRPARAKTFLHGVSAAQQATAPPGVPLLPYIPNGVDVERFRPRAHKKLFALTLGRICPEKGIHLAQEACRLARMPLRIGGQVYRYEEHERYYREEVAPGLNDCCRFLGPLGLRRKARLLAAARCVLIPSLAAETSSLTAMEALASGTPVVAFRSGALPTLIEHGKTGFLVKDARQMAEAIGRVEEISPDACRRAAEARFDSRVTATAYMELYRGLISTR